MADVDATTQDDSRQARRRRPSLLTLLLGVAALVASAYIITDGAAWLPSMDPRWVLAGGALVIGLLLLGASLASGRRR